MSNDEYASSELSESASTVESGLNLLKQGNTAGAAHLFEQAVAVNPADAAAWQYLGIARTQMGDAQGGVAALRRAVDLLPANAGMWCNLGVALSRTGSPDAADAARGALQQALALDPNHAKAQAALVGLPPAPSAAVPEPLFPASAMSTLGAPAVAAPASPPLPPAPFYEPHASASPAGAAYAPASPVRVAYAPTDAPAAGTRLVRGLGWGFVCGQYWTAWNFFWAIVYGEAGHGLPSIIKLLVGFFVVFGIAGSIVGLVAGAINATIKTGATIGIVAGMLLFGGLFLLQGGNAMMLINGFFWFFTGRFVGANTAQKIQRAG